MRHVVIVCLLLLAGLGASFSHQDNSIRVSGALGELATQTIQGQGVDIQKDGVFTIIELSRKDTVVRALCQTYQNLERERDIHVHNLSNVETTRTECGEPYRRQYPVYDAKGSFVRIERDNTDFYWTYDPSHPDAMTEGAKAGYVAKSNVSPDVESQALTKLETEQGIIRNLVRHLEPELVFCQDQISQQPTWSAPKDVVIQSTPRVFNLIEMGAGRDVPFPLSDQICVKQSNSVACGQASVAVALNCLSGSNLTDLDIDEHYGFQLLEALIKESPQDIHWRDAGNLGHDTWPLIEETLSMHQLPVIVAFAGPTDPTNRGYIVTLLKVEGDIVTYADPLTGTFKTTSKKELVTAPSHPDGNFIFIPKRIPLDRESLRLRGMELLNRPLRPNGLL